MAKKTVQMDNNLKGVKPEKKEIPPQKDPTPSQKEEIQKRLNEAGQKAIQESKDPELQKQAETMARRLGRIDECIQALMDEEGDDLHPQQVVELLIVKARHFAFAHTPDADASRCLIMLIEMILFNAHEVFSVTKAHLIAQSQEEFEKNNEKNAENPQKQEKKSPKRAI